MAKVIFQTKENWSMDSIPMSDVVTPNLQLIRPLTLEQQIERFTAAGKRMEELAGLGVYDFDNNAPLDDLLDDPTRDPEFDLIDAAVAQRDLFLKYMNEHSQSANADGTDTQSPHQNNSVEPQKDSDNVEPSPAPPEGQGGES